MKPVPNLSRAMTLLLRFQRREHGWYEDLRAWGAPGECYADVSRGLPRRFRTVRKHVEGVTGLKFNEFCRRVHARVSYKWLYVSGLAEYVSVPNTFAKGV